jgi:PAS domain S-box-containing protein
VRLAGKRGERRRNVKRDSSQRRTVELAHLGFYLSAATEPVQAANRVMETSLKFFDWDAGFIALYDSRTDTAKELVNIDTIAGRRVRVPSVLPAKGLTPLMRQVMQDGPRLILRHNEKEGPTTVRFGDTSRVSMSLIFVPVRIEKRNIGVLSVQSYRTNAYKQADLEILQGLADHAAGALARLQAESALKESEERFREISQRLSYHVDNSPLGVVEWGVDMRLTRWSGAAERVFGWKAEEMLGKRMEDLRWVYEEDLPQVKTLAMELRAGEIPRSFSANRNYRKDGSVIYCEWYNSALIGDHGELRSVLSLVLDVTERRLAEARLREAQALLQAHAEKLEETVAGRTAKLQETIAELQHFSYALIHDMRAPLRAMSGFAQIIEEECRQTVTPNGLELCRKIQTSARRLDSLIQDALNYSGATLEDWLVHAVDPGRLLTDLIDSYPDLQKWKGEIHIESPLPVVMGNDAALTQCFSNLLRNAVKFVQPGAVPKVRVWGEKTENRARIWVEDKGIGIPLHAQRRIFDMFQRATAGYEGTGIGLAIVRKVAQRMGGSVGVESEEGEGSRFWVELVAA